VCRARAAGRGDHGTVPTPKTIEVINVGGVDVAVTNPDKVFFPALGLTKVDLVRYCVDVMPGVLAGARDQPTLLKRHLQPSKARGATS
jgi:hypothetical protein